MNPENQISIFNPSFMTPKTRWLLRGSDYPETDEELMTRIQEMVDKGLITQDEDDIYVLTESGQIELNAVLIM